jgi:putative isomerase
MQPDIAAYIEAIREHVYQQYDESFREPGGPFRYPFLTPGSKDYHDVLWDWDSWLSDVALRQILKERGSAEEQARALPYERGCVLNYLSWGGPDGWIPIDVRRVDDVALLRPRNIYEHNMHKPVLAQHSAFLVQQDGGDAEWLRDLFYPLQTFIGAYKFHHRHRCGLYYWQDDERIGVDSDPCTYFRPARSSGSIFLNCLMVRELQAAAYLADRLALNGVADELRADAEDLRRAIREHCWDERDGSFYSVDLNLQSNEHVTGLHSGHPRDWDCLIQRIGVWSSFLALWAGVATPEQAERVVAEHYREPRTFCAPFGVRTLSRMEKMFRLRASSNPSPWLGPVWGVSNYLVFRGLLGYGFVDDARDLAEKTVRLFGRDFERFGALHECYQPENGEPILNLGFKNWNLLVLNMSAWLEGNEPIAEFVEP